MKMPAAVIREEISKRGAISFARFMEIALYCPETGYYETKKDIIGQRGDFITSVSTGSFFGELLAFQFAEWLKEMPAPAHQLTLVEAGAHSGQLAADILNWLQTNRPELFERIEYVIIEPSPHRRQWQQQTLSKFGKKVRSVVRLSESPSVQRGDTSSGTIIFSNELLDAFPVHRFGWDAAKKEWFEYGVSLDGEDFVWSKIPVVRDAGFMPADIPPSLLEVLPDGYIVETSPAAEAWWREAAAILSNGKILTIDYGYTAEEQFSPARQKGTLRAYHQHHVTDDLLANPGGQDLTAHINFSAVQTTGETAGLRTEQFCTQPQFLTRILQKAVAQKEKTFTQLTPKQIRQFQTLTHPDHLGRAFRVLVQAR